MLGYGKGGGLDDDGVSQDTGKASELEHRTPPDHWTGDCRPTKTIRNLHESLTTGNLRRGLQLGPDLGLRLGLQLGRDDDPIEASLPTGIGSRGVLNHTTRATLTHQDVTCYKTWPQSIASTKQGCRSKIVFKPNAYCLQNRNFLKYSTCDKTP